MIKAFPLQSHERFNISHTDNVTLLFEKKKKKKRNEERRKKEGDVDLTDDQTPTRC